MFEIEIAARDLFCHYITVDSADKALVWWFNTKRKNISFGLYFKKETAISVREVAASPDVRSKGLPPLPPVDEDDTRPPPSSHGEANVSVTTIASYASSGQNTSVISMGQSSRIYSGKLTDNDLVEVMPIQHYESSKMTIKGQYNVERPGTYALVFGT
jgi:hypothetical protein